jgi:hypothetical protein
MALKLLTLSFIALFAASTAKAGSIGLEGNFFNSAHSLSNEKNTQLIYGDVFLTLPFYEKASVHFVFNYTFLQESYKSSDTTTVGILHSGPMAGLRTRFWEVCYLTVLGTPYIQADYSVTGNPKEQWSGFAYQARLSLEGELSRNVGLIASVNYFAATYNQKSAGATSTQSTMSRAAIIPAAGLIFRF